MAEFNYENMLRAALEFKRQCDLQDEIDEVNLNLKTPEQKQLERNEFKKRQRHEAIPESLICPLCDSKYCKGRNWVILTRKKRNKLKPIVGRTLALSGVTAVCRKCYWLLKDE